jgi:UDP-glucuronate 4-epimerase
MSTYVVTGAAGFIASRVSDLLLRQGHHVVGLDNLNDAYDIRLKNWRLDQLTGQPNFEFHLTDITDLIRLRAVLKQVAPQQPQAIINLAARAGVRRSVEDPWSYVNTNTTGTLNLLEMCREFGIGKFILASTSSLYGGNNPQPFKESGDTSAPLSPYAASKKAAEAMCHTYHYLHKIDITVFRYFTVYGPAGRPDMSPFRFVQWISEGRPLTVFGDGQQSRDFTYVDDIARGTISGLKPMGYEVINLGSDTPIMLLDVVKVMEELIGAKAAINFQSKHSADMQETWADIGKAKALLDWEPRVNFHQGLHELVRWYQANRSWAKVINTAD